MILRSVFILIFALSIWGNIADYTDGTISIYSPSDKHEKGKTETFMFTDDVTIDTYTLEENEMGNVRIEVNDDGRVEKVYFYGIDMPDVIDKYKDGGKRR